MAFTIKKIIPVSIVSDGGDILGNEMREVVYFCKITSITITDDKRGEATLSRSTTDASMVNYFTYPFAYELGLSIFTQAEKQIIAMKEYAGAEIADDKI